MRERARGETGSGNEGEILREIGIDKENGKERK